MPKKIEILKDKRKGALYVRKQVQDAGHRTGRVYVPRDWIGQFVDVYLVNTVKSDRTASQ